MSSMGSDARKGSRAGLHYHWRYVLAAVIVAMCVGRAFAQCMEQKLTAPDADAYDWFGYSVSVSGDTALVGVPKDDCAAGENCGSAYVFRWPDCNENGIHDECEFVVPGDLNGDQAIGAADVLELLTCLTGPCGGNECAGELEEACCSHANLDGDADVDLHDVVTIHNAQAP